MYQAVVIFQPIGLLVIEVELVYWAAIMFIRVIPGFWGLASDTRCKRQPKVCTEHLYVVPNLQ